MAFLGCPSWLAGLYFWSLNRPSLGLDQALITLDWTLIGLIWALWHLVRPLQGLNSLHTDLLGGIRIRKLAKKERGSLS